MTQDKHDGNDKARIPEVTRYALFSPGDIVAGRYEITRFIDQGSMGVVYEAFDCELSEPVAFKSIRLDVAADTRNVKRFKREIQLARKVTHPHVCRLFDVGFHFVEPCSLRGWPGGNVAFLTMELLHGETLEQRLAKGPLDMEQASLLMGQMVGALGAAHRAGVIHGDFKSGNVMLVKRNGQDHVVVTDFGLARSVQHDSHYQSSVTGFDSFVGTPAFMAPEQVEGGVITVATDVYALGCTLYQMVTGEVPFLGENIIQTALKRLVSRPDPPRDKRPGLSHAWNDAILKSLEREPTDRFDSVDDFQEYLNNPPRRVPFGLLSLLLVLLVLVVGVFSITRQREDGPVIEIEQPLEKQKVAILTLSGDSQYRLDGDMMGEFLYRALALSEEIELVPLPRTIRVLNEIGVPISNAFDQQILDLVAKNLKVDWVVYGSYRVDEDTPKRLYHLSISGFGVGRAQGNLGYEGSDEDLGALMRDTAMHVLHEMQVQLPQYSAFSDLTVSPKGELSAKNRFALAKQAVWQFQIESASNFLQDLIETEPDNGEYRFWDALVLAYGGQRQASLDQAARSLELVSRVPGDQQLELERLGQILSEYRALVDSYSRFVGLEDEEAGSQDVVLSILSDLESLLKPAQESPPETTSLVEHEPRDRQELIMTVAETRLQLNADMIEPLKAELDNEQLSLSERAAIMHNIGVTYHAVGEHESSRRYLNDAISHWKQLDDLYGESRSVLQRAFVLMDTGDLSQALDDASTARVLMEREEKNDAACWALLLQGRVEAEMARYPQALDVFHKASLQFDRHGIVLGSALAHLDASRVHLGLGSWSRAASEAEAARFRLHKLGERQYQVQAYSVIARSYFELKQWDQLIMRCEEAQTLMNADTSILEHIDLAHDMGRAYIEKGDVPKARLQLERGVSIARELGHKDKELVLTRTLARLYEDLGRYHLASKVYSEAIRLAEDLLDDSLLPSLWLSRGKTLYSEGGLLMNLADWPNAAKRFEEALDSFSLAGDQTNQAVTHELVARCRFATGDNEVADTHMQMAIQLWDLMGSKRRSARVWQNWAADSMRSDHLQVAKTKLRMAANIYRELDDHHGEIGALEDMLKVSIDLKHEQDIPEIQRRIRELQRKSS